MLRSPWFRRTPLPKLIEIQLCCLPLLRTSKGGTSVDFATCLCLGRSYEHLKPTLALVITCFHSLHPKWDFPLRRAEPSCGISVVCEAGHTSESQDCSYKPPPHSHAYYVTPPRFLCDSDAPEPLVPSNPPKVDRNSTVSSTPSTNVEWVYLSGLCYMFVLG